MTTCALVIGAKAKAASHTVVLSKVLSPRICDPFRCLRFMELHRKLCCRKEQSAMSATITALNPFVNFSHEAEELPCIYPYAIHSSD
jgi:hypothetical protein